MRNFESNETSPSSLAQKLSEIWDFKNGIWKKAVLRKWLFKMLVIFFLQYEIVYFSKFLSFNSALLCKNKMCYRNSSECHVKGSHFFLLVSTKIWNSNILNYLQKVAISRFPEAATWSLFWENATILKFSKKF